MTLATTDPFCIVKKMNKESKNLGSAVHCADFLRNSSLTKFRYWYDFTSWTTWSVMSCSEVGRDWF